MKVFFNNSCKICRAEINIYKKENIENLNWIDITKNKNAELETKKTDKELLRRLHVEQDGKIYVGIDAFLLIWYKSLGLHLSVFMCWSESSACSEVDMYFMILFSFYFY